MNSVHNTSQAHCNIPPQESLKIDVKWVFVTKMELSLTYEYTINSYYSLFVVNSEANARRIAMVESCFGRSGQVRGILRSITYRILEM